MSTPSKADCETLSDVAKSFSQNVIRINGKGREEALAAFSQNARMVDKVKLVVTKVASLLIPSFFYKTRAKLIVRNCEQALPVLTRAFGEAAMVDAMRAEPRRSESLANVTERFGGKKIAALIRRSLSGPAP
jgi:hypothetical protein